MKKDFILVGFALMVLVFAACSNDPTVNPNGTDTTGDNTVFQEIDRIGKPGIKELYLPYSTHQAYNVANPVSDPGTYGPAVGSFVTGTAGRSAAIGSFVATLLLPDALIANLNSSSTRADYLGWETNGQIASDCTGLSGTPFGGRALDDDVVDTDLGLAFGNLATSSTITTTPINVPASPPPDDGKEKNGLNGTPNLTKQNVPCTNQGFTPSTFPYLAPPV